jgi:hypothetical protein
LTVTPLRRLTLSATPAAARSTMNGQTTEVRELDVSLVLRVLRRLSFTAAARASNQNGRFGVLDPTLVTLANDPIQSRRLWLTATLTLP